LGNLIILLTSLAFLVLGSDLTISNSLKVSEITGFGKTTVGFVLVGFSTSLPELSVSVFAVANPDSVGVSIGNVLGSNIVNIALILGVCILLVVLRRPRYPSFLLTMAKEEMGSLYFGLFVASIIPLALLYIGYASRFIGVILVGIFVFYMIQLSRINKKRAESPLPSERKQLRGYAFLAVAGAVVVIATAFFIVESASLVALSVGIPRVVIGATVVAFGTSIPELATSISSVRKGHFDLALGNIVGSGFVNITCILGVALIGSPLTVNIAAFSNLVLFSLITNLFLWYFLSSEKISWREGALLLVLYAVFLVISFGGYQP
jgi:cation:H+ antiporter